jgi:fumarate hydratase class I
MWTLQAVKLASTRYFDNLHTSGNEFGRAFRDYELEAQVMKLTQKMGIGAQFGGKYFCHDVRVIRLPRHGASCPVGMYAKLPLRSLQILQVSAFAQI